MEIRNAGRSAVRRSVRRARHARRERLSGRIRAPAIAQIPRSANLAEANAEKFAAPRSPAVAPVRMMAPCRRAAMCGMTACTAPTAPRHATRQACSNSLAVVCSNGLISSTCALWISTSITIGVRPDRGGDIRRLRDIAGEMGVFAAGLFDAARQMFRRPCRCGRGRRHRGPPGRRSRRYRRRDLPPRRYSSSVRLVERAIVIRSSAGCWR